MNCGTAREQLLEADLEVLKGEGDSALALHVRECARCRAVAQAILEGQEELDRALGAVQPGVATEEAIRHIPRRVRRRTPVVKILRRSTIPLAAAASLALLLLLRPSRPGPVSPGTRATSPSAEAQVRVTVPPGRTVAVFETSNPNITVVWFFDRGRTIQ